MAKILRTDDQSKALSRINRDLQRIDEINIILSSGDKTGDLTLSTSDCRLKMNIYISEITPLITGLRKAMIDEVRQLSKQYFINLDANDLSILQGNSRKEISYEENRT